MSPKKSSFERYYNSLSVIQLVIAMYLDVCILYFLGSMTKPVKFIIQELIETLFGICLPRKQSVNV